MAQAFDLQAKLLPSYLATVKATKRGVQPPPCSLTLAPLFLYLSLLSPLPFLFVFFPLPSLSLSFSLAISLSLSLSPFYLLSFPLHFYNKALKL
jgi:hypothetical protein